MYSPTKVDNVKSVKVLLYIAAIYHILWGLSVICFPHFWFYWTSIEMINHTCIWQYIGIVAIFFGIGFLIASTNIYRHWLLIFTSLMIKTTTLIGFFLVYFSNDEMRIFNFMLIHFIIWIIPLSFILYKIYNYEYILDKQLMQLHEADRVGIMEMYFTNKGENLATISKDKPVLLIFLRHLGCSFCKETLDIVRQHQAAFDSKNIAVVLVSMSNEKNCKAVFHEHQLDQISFVCDRESILYKSFNLKRGGFFQLFGWKVWRRAIQLRLSKKISLDFIDRSDIYQMPGIFLIYKNKIVHQYKYKSAADKAPIADFLDKV